MKIKEIKWQETIPVRHKVLWPNEDASFCKVEGDKEALHFAVVVEAEICCVASLYLNDDTARLRKFATLQDSQGKGIGSFMLNYLINELKKLNVKYFWFDARESAVAFYRRFGFESEGTRFYKKEVPYFKMSMPL